MGFKQFAFALVVLIGTTHAFPAVYDNEDAEEFPVGSEIGGNNGFGLGNFPSFNGFGDFGYFPSIQAWIDRLQQTIANAWSSVDIDLDKGNTTSETKIVNGQCLQINRTVYNQGNVQAVRESIDVQPLSVCGESTVQPGTGTGSTPLPPVTVTKGTNSDIETFGDKQAENERKSTYDNLETFDEVDFDSRHRYQVDDVEEFAGNDIESIEYHQEKPFDFTRDTYVNELMAKRGAAVNPDAEQLDIETFANNPRVGNRLRNRNA